MRVAHQWRKSKVAIKRGSGIIFRVDEQSTDSNFRDDLSNNSNGFNEQGGTKTMTLELPINRQPAQQNCGNLLRQSTSEFRGQILSRRFTRGERKVAENPRWPREFVVDQHEGLRNTFLLVLPRRSLQEEIQGRHTAVKGFSVVIARQCLNSSCHESASCEFAWPFSSRRSAAEDSSSAKRSAWRLLGRAE